MNSNTKNIWFSSLLAAVSVTGSYYLLDKPVAFFVKKVLMAKMDVFSSNVPDVLFLIVCVVSGASWAAYLYLTRHGVYNQHTRFSRMIAVTLPLTFVAKSVLKMIVGRIDARFWVQYPRAREFHWFHGSGNYTSFPSGHMAVFTAFFLAVARYYPRYRYAAYGCLAVLSVALIATNYHFLSDVIAGAYVGFIGDYFVQWFFSSRNNRET